MAFDLDEDELKATRKMNKADRNEIEVGEYVRTEKGLIAKYLGFEKDDNDMEYNKHLFDNKIYWYYEYYNEYVYEEDWEQFKENIVKHSKQLIDLIEVKDVIKYKINNISTTLETKGYVEGIVDISDEEMLQKIKSDKNYHILEILTKERYMTNCYKVGGEDGI